jgi:deoxyribonuclease-4
VEFGDAVARNGWPLYVHAIYLLNLATGDDVLARRTSEALAYTWWFASLAGARGVVVHVGSHKGEGFAVGLPRVVGAVEAAREAVPAVFKARGTGPGDPEFPPLLLETSAGSPTTMGRDLDELGRLRACLPGDVGLCLDSAHLFAAGVPVHTPAGIDRLVVDLDALAGLGAVRLVHLNDSKTAFGSLHDKHENLWQGRIARAGLAAMVGHPAFREVPFILEVPGIEGHGPDRLNIGRAKLMRRQALAHAAAAPARTA